MAPDSVNRSIPSMMRAAMTPHGDGIPGGTHPRQPNSHHEIKTSPRKAHAFELSYSCFFVRPRHIMLATWHAYILAKRYFAMGRTQIDRAGSCIGRLAVYIGLSVNPSKLSVNSSKLSVNSQ